MCSLNIYQEVDKNLLTYWNWQNPIDDIKWYKALYNN